MAGSEKSDAAGRNASARDRLENLKARRAAGTGPQALMAGASAKRGNAGAGAGAGFAKGAGQGAGGKGGMASRVQAALKGPDGADKRKAMMRVVRVLTDTPDDGSGIVAGTPFSYAGVKKLVDMLETRSKEKAGKGAAVATQVLLALSKGDGDGSDRAIHGIQLRRLEQLAKLGEQMKNRVGGRS